MVYTIMRVNIKLFNTGGRPEKIVAIHVSGFIRKTRHSYAYSNHKLSLKQCLKESE